MRLGTVTGRRRARGGNRGAQVHRSMLERAARLFCDLHEARRPEVGECRMGCVEILDDGHAGTLKLKGT